MLYFISNKIYEPSFIINTEIIKNILFILDSDDSDLSWKKYLYFVIGIIFIIFFLIFYEFIEINCFGLSQKTKRNLKASAQKELLENDKLDDDEDEEKAEIDGFLVEIENMENMDLNEMKDIA